MRAIVVGGSGQIGGWLLHFLAERGHTSIGTYHTVPFEGLVPLDTANLKDTADWIRGERPDAVFYPAGFTWVDGCERDPSRARAANLEQPLNVARATAESGGKFVYYSTDYVFDGLAGPYQETSPTNALSVYGQSKLEAEHELTRALGSSLLLLRTCWVYGPERQGKNFSYQLVKTLGEKKDLTCPSDQIASPTYGPDIARVSIAMLESGHSGLFHVAGPETISRVAFAKALADGFGLDSRLIVAKLTAELGQGAPRPLNSGLLTQRLDAILPGMMRSLVQALPDFRASLSPATAWSNPQSRITA